MQLITKKVAYNKTCIVDSACRVDSILANA